MAVEEKSSYNATRVRLGCDSGGALGSAEALFTITVVAAAVLQKNLPFQNENEQLECINFCEVKQLLACILLLYGTHGDCDTIRTCLECLIKFDWVHGCRGAYKDCFVRYCRWRGR